MLINVVREAMIRNFRYNLTLSRDHLPSMTEGAEKMMMNSSFEDFECFLQEALPSGRAEMWNLEVFCHIL
jgi:hypothetical protein